MSDCSAKYDARKDVITEEILKDISLSMNFARIDLIENLHPYKSVEDNGEVLRGRGSQWLSCSIFNAHKLMALEE